MAEITGLVVGIVQLCGSISGYIKTVKEGPDSCQSFRAEIDSVLSLVTILLSKGSEEKPEPWKRCMELITGHDGPLIRLRDLLSEVDAKLIFEKISDHTVTSASNVESQSLGGKSGDPQGGNWRERLKQKFKGSISVPQMVLYRATWPFTEMEVINLLSRMERYKSWIQLALANDHLALSSEINDKVAIVAEEVKTTQDLTIEVKNNVETVVDSVKTMKESYNAQQREIVLRWLSPLSFGKTQQDIFARWQKGTGQWLLDNPSFKDWLNGSRDTLFCPGIPGAGKSVMASMVINHLQELTEPQNSISLGFIFCNYKEQDQQTVQHLFGSILSQIASNSVVRDSIVSNIEELHLKHSQIQTRPTVEEILHIIKIHLQQLSRVYIVIDALDECKSEAQYELSHHLRELCSSKKMSVLVTSRDVGTLKHCFSQDGPVLEIEATDSDIRAYLREQLPQRVATRLNIPPDLADEIINVISGKADKMFLLAKLHMEDVLRKHSIQQIRATLKSLPVELYDTYDAAMIRILGQPKEDVELAKAVLTWITTAFRPLLTIELQHALASDSTPTSTKFDNEGLISEETLVRVCSGLVVIDHASQRARLVHYSAQEYFEKAENHEQYFPEAHEDIVRTSLIYLSFNEFSGCCTSGDAVRHRLHSHPFLKYAAMNWKTHARSVSQARLYIIQPMIFDFFNNKGNIAFNIQLMRARLYTIRGATRQAKIQLYISQANCKLLTAALFDNVEILRDELKHGVNCNTVDPHGRSALSIAAELGHWNIVQELLAVGDLEPNYSSNENSWTPLIWAVRAGHEKIVKLLLSDPRVDPNLEDNNGWTPLRWAVVNRHESVFHALLGSTKLDHNRPDAKGVTPLAWAISTCQSRIIQLLVNCTRFHLGQSSQDLESFKFLWSWAVRNGDQDLMNSLLIHPNLDVSWKTQGTWSPLIIAIEYNHPKIVQKLLTLNTASEIQIPIFPCFEQPNLPSTSSELSSQESIYLGRKRIYYEGQTPLHSAAQYGRGGIAQMLLSIPGIDPNMEIIKEPVSPKLTHLKGSHMTPLILAIRSSHKYDGSCEVIKHLLSHPSIDPNLPDTQNHWAPLTWAAIYSHKEATKLLLAHPGINLSCGQSLRAAFERGDEEIVQLMLASKSCDPNTGYEDINNHVLFYTALPITSIGLKPFRSIVDRHVALFKRVLATSRIDVNVGAGMIEGTVLHRALSKFHEMSFTFGRLFKGIHEVELPPSTAGFPAPVSDCITFDELRINHEIKCWAEATIIQELIIHDRIDVHCTNSSGDQPLIYALKLYNSHDSKLHAWQPYEAQAFLDLIKALLQRGLETNCKNSRAGVLLCACYDPMKLCEAAIEGDYHEALDTFLRWEYWPQQDHDFQFDLLLLAEHASLSLSWNALTTILNRHESLGKDVLEIDFGKLLLTSLCNTPSPKLQSFIKRFLGTFHNINFDCTNEEGKTPLQIQTARAAAAMPSYLLNQGPLEVLKMLVEAGGINLQVGEGTRHGSLVHIAVIQYNPTVIRYLVERGVKPDLRDCDGRTPLSHAAQIGEIGPVQLLLRLENVNPLSRDDMGLTPLDWALLEGHSHVADMLWKYDIYDPDSLEMMD